MRNRNPQAFPGPLSIMTLSVTAALAVMWPTLAQAACITLSSNATVTGPTSTCLTWAGGNLSLTNNGTLNGPSSPQVEATGSLPGTLTNRGLISGASIAILNSGTISLVNNNGGRITGTGVALSGGAGSSIGTLTNTGRISGTTSGISLGSGARITSLFNNVSGTLTGTISGQTAILSNAGTIGSLSNTGIINGTTLGISMLSGANLTSLLNNTGGTISGQTAISANNSPIGTLTNTGQITGTTLGIKLVSGASITSLINNAGGTISGPTAILSSAGTIGSLSNTGRISGTTLGISLLSGGNLTSLLNNTGGTISGQTAISASNSTIGTLTNTGQITGTTLGVKLVSGASITSLINNASGTISGPTAILSSASTIGTLTNSGLISGSSFALKGGFGVVANDGVIAGNIQRTSGSPLTITGGTGSIFGTLTGSGISIGTITNTSSNLVFSSGNLLLNDHINVGSNTVTNSGSTLQINNSITITGNYSQSANAVLLMGVADGATSLGSTSDTGYGRLMVSGTANLAQGSSVTLQKLSTYAFAAGQRFVVIDALAAGTNYNASTLNYSAAGSSLTACGAAVANGSNSSLVVSLLSAPCPTPPSNTAPTSGATIPNAVSALGGLSNYTGISDAGLLNLYNASLALNASGSSAELNRAGKQLTPNTQAPSSQAAAAPTYDVLNIINSHSDGLRLSRAQGSGISTGEGSPQSDLWGQAFDGHASQDQRNQVDGYSANFSGLLIGGDRMVSDSWRLGGLLSYSSATADNNGDTSGNSTKVVSYGLFGYGSYIANKWYANVAAGVLQQNYDTKRAISFPGFAGNTTGSFNGQQYVLRGEAGYPIPVGYYTVTPTLGLTFSHLRQEGYTESGGSGAALSVNSSHTNSATSDIGAKLEREFASSYGTVVPELRLAWRHEYDNTRARTTANFAGDTTGQTSFTTLGAGPVEDSALVSIGVTLLKSKDLNLSVRYDGQIGGGYRSSAGSLRLRTLF